MKELSGKYNVTGMSKHGGVLGHVVPSNGNFLGRPLVSQRCATFIT
jgi:hypothetical protein